MGTIVQQQSIRVIADGTIAIVHSSGTYANPNSISSWTTEATIGGGRFRPTGRANNEYEVRATMTGPATNVVNPITNWTDAGSLPMITMRVMRTEEAVAGVTAQSNTFNYYVRKKNNIADQVNGNIVLNNRLTTEGTITPIGPGLDDGLLGPVYGTYEGQDANYGMARIDVRLNYGVVEALIILRGRAGFGQNDSTQTKLLYSFDTTSPIPLNYYEMSIEVLSEDSDYDNSSLVNNTTSGWAKQTTTSPTTGLYILSNGGEGAWMEARIRIIVRRISDQVEVMRKQVTIRTLSLN